MKTATENRFAMFRALSSPSKTSSRPIFEEYGGHVFLAEGDGVNAALQMASDAVDAAVGIQQQLSPHAGDPPFRARIGLHTG